MSSLCTGLTWYFSWSFSSVYSAFSWSISAMSGVYSTKMMRDTVRFVVGTSRL